MAQIMAILAAAGAAAGGAQNNNNNNNNNRAAQIARNAQIAQMAVLTVAMLEEYKQAIKVQHNIDLSELMQRAADLNRLSAPAAEDIRRAKMASSLYLQASIRDPASALDQADLSDLKKQASKSRNLVKITTDENGRIHVSGDLAKLVELAEKIDEVPMRLPPPPAKRPDDYLDKYLTPGLYRMAGIRMTYEEKAFFDRLAASGGQEFVIDPAQAEAQVALNGLNKMIQKSKAFESWITAL